MQQKFCRILKQRPVEEQVEGMRQLLGDILDFLRKHDVSPPQQVEVE